MIGVDYGSSTVKWFDGKRFGTGLPEGRGLVVGLSSKTVLVKEAVFPLCRGKQLEKMVLNEVVSDLSVEPSQVAVAFCPAERLEKGCRHLIFVEKRELLEALPPEVKEGSTLTVDLIGALSAATLLYPDEDLTVVDAGEGKVGFYFVSGSRLRAVEVFRLGYRSFVERFGELSVPKVSGRLVLIGGGALSEEFVELFKEFSPLVPEIPPFGEETPLYFNAYGLYHFKKSPCRAAFAQPSLLSSEFFQKNRGLFVRAGALVGLSLILLTAAEAIRVKVARDDYLAAKREFKERLSELLGEKVLIPEVQIPQKLEELKALKELLKVDQPGALLYLRAISESTTEGVRVLEVKGSASSGQFTVVGRFESEEALEAFVSSLKRRFKKVSVSVDGNRFRITLWRVKVGAEEA